MGGQFNSNSVAWSVVGAARVLPARSSASWSRDKRFRNEASIQCELHRHCSDPPAGHRRYLCLSIFTNCVLQSRCSFPHSYHSMTRLEWRSLGAPPPPTRPLLTHTPLDPATRAHAQFMRKQSTRRAQTPHACSGPHYHGTASIASASCL